MMPRTTMIAAAAAAALLLGALPAMAQPVPQQRGASFPYMVLKPPGMPGLARPYTQAAPMPPAQRAPFVLNQGGVLRRNFGTATLPGMLRSSFGRATRR